MIADGGANNVKNTMTHLITKRMKKLVKVSSNTLSPSGHRPVQSQNSSKVRAYVIALILLY